MSGDTLRTFGIIILAVMGLGLVGSGLVIAIAIRQLRRIEVPADATFAETMKLVPFLLVVGLDLLDLGLDVFSVPIVWVMLDRLGLRALRNVSVVEAAFPFTGPIPTLTLCWIGVRLFHPPLTPPHT